MKSAKELVDSAKTQIKEVTCREAQQHLAPSQLIIDVREPAEYAQGHLAGAVNIPRGLLEFQIAGAAAQDAARPILVYCKSGGRSALAAMTLQTMGYHNVISLAGGIDTWTGEGLDLAP